MKIENELKALCAELKSGRGRKDHIINRVFTELGILKSGIIDAGEVDESSARAVSSFDANTKQQYHSLGKLSRIAGE